MTAVPYTYPGSPYPTLQSFHPLPPTPTPSSTASSEAQAFCCSAVDRFCRYSRLTITLQDRLRGRTPKPLQPQIDIDQETTSRPIHPHNQLSAQHNTINRGVLRTGIEQRFAFSSSQFQALSRIGIARIPVAAARKHSLARTIRDQRIGDFRPNSAA
jgi:hypothetical protein